MKKKIYRVIIVAIALLLIGVIVNVTMYPVRGTEKFRHSMYDSNRKVAQLPDMLSIHLTEKRIEGQRFTGDMKRLEGTHTIWTFDSEEDMELDLTYLINVRSGKVKLVLISPNNKVTNTVEITTTSDAESYATSPLHIKKGMNRIKMVGAKGTSFDFDITIPKGNFED